MFAKKEGHQDIEEESSMALQYQALLRDNNQ